MKSLITVSLVLVLSACVSVRDAGSAYFKSGTKYAGIESPDVVLKRAERPAQLRELMYGRLSPARLIQCTILRHQLYVAALTSSNQEIRLSAISLEKAYQQDDQSFLSVCDQIAGTALGKSFGSIAQGYLGRN